MRDEFIIAQQPKSGRPGVDAPDEVALVEVDSKEREMTFLTNNLEWSPSSVAAPYKCRWDIEVFFKQIKQTLNWPTFWGTTPTPCAGRSGRHC